MKKYLTIILSILFLNFISSLGDVELYQICGGDNELKIMCNVGDSFSVSKIIGEITYTFFENKLNY